MVSSAKFELSRAPSFRQTCRCLVSDPKNSPKEGRKKEKTSKGTIHRYVILL